MNNKNKRTGSKGAVVLFAILVLGSATGNLSQTALNSMLGAVIADFGVGVGAGQWLTTIYMLTLGITVPLTSFLTKRTNLRTYVLVSLAIFFAGAFVDAITPAFWLIIVGRVLQAISAGLLMPVMQNVAMTAFGLSKSATAMGIAGVAMGFAPNIGPTIGSLFAIDLSWRVFFVFLAIIPVVLIVIGLFVLPKTKSQKLAIKLDVGSFLLSIIGFGGILSGLSEGSNSGFTSPFVLIALIVGVVGIVWFLRRQKSIANPLINLSIFKSKQYTNGFIMQNLLFGSFLGITLTLSLYVQHVLSGTSIDAGMALLPGAIMALIFNPVGGILGDKFGKTFVIRAGAIIYTMGALLALIFDERTALWVVEVCQGVRGMGVSLSMGCTITWMLERLPKNTIGDGSSFTIMVRQASASLGTAVMVLLISALPAMGISEVAAFRWAFGFSALLGIIMLIMSFKTTTATQRTPHKPSENQPKKKS